MKHFTFKTRVSIWYAVLLVLFMTAAAVLLMLIANNTIIGNTRKNLVNAVDLAVDSVTVSEGRVTIRPDLNYTLNGVSISVYDRNGLLISGLEPDGFGADKDFIDDEIRDVESGKKYFVYDRLLENESSGNIWIRGVTSAEIRDMAPDFVAVVNTIFLMIPLLIFIAVLGGLLITENAFKPLGKITDTAERISESGDLSQRIGIGDAGSNDEITRAAGVFDNMLEKVESAFENEKRFTNDASHELRTPISVIMAESEYALDELDDRDEVKGALESINSESEKMKSLVSQLLMLARADHGNIKLDKVSTDISLLAEEAKMALSDDAEKKGISIEIDAEEGIYMDADPAFFSRIFENLFSNAIKYGKENGHIYCEVKKNENKICIVVRDDGIGVPEKDLPHIFERFYRVKHTNDQESMGLGLPIVKWIVEEHGGTIECASVQDVGTRFTMEFSE